MGKKQKFYAIYKGSGRIPDIVGDWTTCRERIHGVAGAIFKGFDTRDQALQWLILHEGGSAEDFFARFPWLDDGERQTVLGETKPRQSGISEGCADGLEAYVDGSFTPDVAAYGYGVVLVRGGEVLEEISGYGKQADAIALRNVAGEMRGSVEAVRRARCLGVKKLTLFFDYQGLQSWALGTWKRNNIHTQAYHRFMQKAMEDMDICFEKVEAHSGDRFNDRADQLAKQGIKEFVDEQK